ncbi:DNA-formamidopyrimidine glycosylase family protein [Frondihabitans australicus]|uniref:DNA-formamidopyrimidine glycosylase family protein n=1 Tax=Frondihabitans australicus TaxID=386892 RepID=UPI000EAD5AE6|nr:DNA-formamidopyrimidine glycosylase family protein [Frondihabitans australicus]
MPEGDTVYRAAKNLDAVLRGQTLTKSDFRVPAFATVDLTGRAVDEVLSVGKHLLHRIGDVTLHTHLKMEGSWHVYRHGTTWKRPAYQARVVLETADWVAVGFDLGIVELVPRDDEESAVGYLGPDLLGPGWDSEVAVANLVRDPDREIGLALLDQRNLAGIGNVYRNELCFLRGVLPTRPVREVENVPKMVDLAYRLLQANKDRVDRTTTGQLRGQTDWVYGRAGRPCRRCGTKIRRGTLGESELELRDTYWCPRCQT